jgi:Glycosyl transferase family 2
MTYAIVTMSRGDEHRLAEWIGYHARIGFDEFNIVLDNPIDNSEALLNDLKSQYRITVSTRAPIGEYYDGMTVAERWARVKLWRVEHAEEVEASGLPINDSLSWRQHRHLPEVLGTYTDRTGWVSVLDVDEFITLSPGRSISDVLGDAKATRVRLLSFDVDTSDHDPARGYLEQHHHRWAREDLIAYGKGWDTRVKSIVRMSAALPLASVHPVSRGPFVVLEPDQGRILHFKTPASNMLPYRIEDRGAQGR